MVGKKGRSGGRRPGAGRKPGTDLTAEARAERAAAVNAARALARARAGIARSLVALHTASDRAPAAREALQEIAGAVGQLLRRMESLSPLKPQR